MRLILAVIEPEKLPAVRTALDEWEVSLLTASEVLDCLKTHSTLEVYRGREVRRPVSKLRLEIAVDDSCLDEAVAAIHRAGGSTNLDGCNVFVIALDGSPRPCACKRDLAKRAALSLPSL